jgi:hypothetical protein
VTFPTGGTNNTALSNPTVVASNASVGTGYYMWAYQATGTGVAAGTVDLTFAQTNTRTVVDVIQISGNDNSVNGSSPIALSGNNNGTGNNATATLSSVTAGDAELGMVLATTNVAVGTPNTFTSIDAVSHGTLSTNTYFGTTPVTSATSAFGSSRIWGTIALEIAHP